MTPTLRSSNTPIKTRSGKPLTPSSTPRRTPQCATCKRPRAGHPRSGCPFSSEVSESLEKMSISSPSGKGEINPSDSLASLSTTSSAIVNNLSFDSEELEGLPPLKFPDMQEEEQKYSRVMPGTFTPLTLSAAPSRIQNIGFDEPISASAAQDAIEPSDSCETILPAEEATQRSDLNADDDDNDTGGYNVLEDKSFTSIAPSFVRPQPTPTRLTRTPTSPSQKAFLASLTQSALFICPAPTDLAYEAQKAGLFYFQIDEDEQSAVIGRDEKAVKVLVEKHKKDAKERKSARKSGGGLTAIAGGAMMGAAATFASLAFA